MCAVEVSPTNQSFGADWAIGAVRLRRDGWSSVSGGYAFAETDTEPQLLTTPVRVPRCGANHSATAVVLLANVQTSVVGTLRCGLEAVGGFVSGTRSALWLRAAPV